MKKVVSLLLVLALGGLAAWYFYSPEEPVPHPSVLVPEPVETAEPAPAVSYPVTPPAIIEEDPLPPLPTLADSDPGFIEALSGLLGAETLGGHFVLEQMINRTVATIDSLDSRQVAPLILPVQPLPGSFKVLGDEALVTDPQNFSRYESLIQILTMVEPERLVRVYRRFYPLFQESYESLGHGDAYFNDRLVEILDHLLDTPQLPAEAVLVKVESVYQFADPEFENLSAGQKMILRSGATHRAAIMEKLAALRSALTG